MPYKYNYIIIPLHFTYVKLGLWNGSIKDLKSRYKTYYGDFEIYAFQCVDNIDNEKYIFSLLKEYKYCGELYDKNVIPKFFEILELVSMKYTNSVDLEHKFIKIRNGYKKIQKEHSKILPMKRSKIIDYKNIFNKVIKEITIKIKVINTKSIDCNLCKFLLENTRYKENNVILLETIRNQFNNWLGKNVRSLDNGTFFQVNKDYVIDHKITCKFCENEHKKGCCTLYNRTSRSTKRIVKNLEMIFLED
jgi:hypothetical protein